MFSSATLRLTGWYMVLLMSLSILFSIVLFTVARNEFGRALGPMRPGEIRFMLTDKDAQTVRQQRIDDSTARLVVSLVIFNLAVLVGGGALSYALAKRTLRPLEVSHEAQVRFTSDAAHELRTPLTVMQTEVEVALRQTKTTLPQAKKVLASTLEEVARLRTLTDHLLQLATEQELSLTTVRLDEAVIEAVTRVVTLAQSKHIAVENTVGVARILAHHDSLVTVIGILLDNAIKYSPDNSTITLRTTLVGGEVAISVTDTGIGISSEDQTKIFERFYRVDSSRTKQTVEGYGLGLSLAQRLVLAMNGRLEVRSELGSGSVFTVTLTRA